MRHGWRKIDPHTTVEEVPFTASVIIAARNEEDNIKRTLDSLIGQNYPSAKFEIIVVDDHSTDTTAAIVKTFEDKGVRLIQLNEKEPLNSYKKLAISKAIAQAEGDVIVTTDADCRMNRRWLSTIMSHFELQGLYMLSAPVLYSEETSFFERIQTLEFLYLIGLGAAGIGNRKPTTCNGANLAYKKDVFYEMGGFQGIDDVASGDDELLLHKVAEKYADKIGFCKSLDAIVYTDAKPTLRSFFSQRKRWASKSTKYKDKKVVLLGVSIWLFNLFFVFSMIYFIFYLPTINYWFLGVLIMKLSVEFLFMKPLCQFTKSQSYLKYLPFVSLLHPFYLVVIGVAGNVGKYDWKGRSVK